MRNQVVRRCGLALLLLVVGLTSCTMPSASGGRLSFMIFGDAAEKAAYEQLVQEFAKKRSDITVDLIHIPDQGDYRKRLGVDFAAGTPADVVLMNYRRYGAFAGKGALEPLTPYLSKSSVIAEGDFYSESLEPFRWDGQIMCIPQNLSSLVVYYNKSMFDQARVAYPQDGWTWADFLSTAQSLTRDLDGDQKTDQYGLGVEASIFRVAPFIWQNGGEIVDNTQNPTRLTIDSPEAREAMTWFVELQTVHHVVPDAVAESAEGSEQRFLNGRLGMFLNSRRGVPTYRTIESFDWDIAPLPVGKQAAGILHADGYCIAAASKNKQPAWAFVEFANSPEGQTIIAKSGRTVPSLRAVAESDAFLAPGVKPENSRVFLDTVPVIRAVPVMETWVDIEDLAGEELERAFYGQASVDEVIKTTIERAQPFLEQHE